MSDRFRILGVNVTAVTRPAATERIVEAAKNRQAFGVSALAVHGLMIGFDDPEFLTRLNELEMVVPDGQPVRWALNALHGTELDERVMGPELMADLCDRAADEAIGIFLFGSTAATLDLLVEHLEADYPGIVISGVQPSRFRSATQEEALADVETIRTSGASIVFVGLGCPRQEIWAWENRSLLEMPVIAVGAAFDYHAGLLSRSPGWMSRNGLEWMYRLAQEPGRLWKRYATTNPRYVWHVVRQRLGKDFPSTGLPPSPVRPG